MSDTTHIDVTLTSDRPGEDRSAVVGGHVYAFAVRTPGGERWDVYVKEGGKFALDTDDLNADGDRLDRFLANIAAIAKARHDRNTEHEAGIAHAHVRKPAPAAERFAYAREMRAHRYGAGRRPHAPQGDAETLCGDPIGPADLTLTEARTRGRLRYVTCPACREEVSGPRV